MHSDGSKSIKTLLVEDDPDLVDVAMGLLELSGCEVTPVHTPEEAMARVTADDYALLFTDYRFPGAVTGIELANRVTEISPHTKVIIATGFDQQTIQAQARDGYQVIYKPYRLQTLQDLVGRLFCESHCIR